MEKYSKLNQDAIRVQKSRVQHLNKRDLYTHIEINNKVNCIVESDIQLQILALSQNNMERLYQIKLEQSNRNSWIGKKSNINMYILLLQKIQLKR